MVKQRLHVYISGRVQGVGFRAFTKRSARDLGLKGWVRNLPDGRVETIVEGRKKGVERFIKILKEGPNGSRVEDVDIKKEDYKDSFSDFKITY
ncbi:MAG: acylphosphatase [Candidatus Aenigmarchaeota archaeon]|nr:acylphosphatase [Candidatus Aenigmarchaeota archaeon]